jgi:hypothetical protein
MIIIVTKFNVVLMAQVSCLTEQSFYQRYSCIQSGQTKWMCLLPWLYPAGGWLVATTTTCSPALGFRESKPIIISM